MNIRLSLPVVVCSLFFTALASQASAAALDSTFGQDGRVAVDLGIRGSRANAVVVQPDGKIVAAGSSSSTADRDFMLFRLLPDGTLDNEFNLDGTVTTAVGTSDDEALSIALQPDGKIIAAGYSSSTKDRDFALVRYNSDGTLDRDFGNEGMVVTPVGSSHDEITDVAVQPDGGIVISGAAQGTNGRVVVLGRYLADGKPDPKFAEQGFALSVVGVDAQAESVALTQDGHLLVAGTYSDGQRRGLMVLNFDSSGHLNQQFGEKGVAVPADNTTFSEGYGMLITEEGRIVVAGSVGKEGERDAALFAFTPEGRPDSTFENNGVLVSSAGEGDDALLDVTAAGRTLSASGFKTTGDSREFLLVTYIQGSTQENTGGSSLAMQTGGQITANVLSTGFSSGKDTSTAIAAASSTSLVAVGESEGAASSSAAVSKYTLTTTGGGSTSSVGSSSSGNQNILTGQPYEVTRTTAIIPVEILSGLSNVTKRGVVFSTMPNPIWKEGSSSSGGGSDAPVMSNLSPSNGTVSGTSATLSLSTDVDATCKYGTTAGTAYDTIENTFSTTGGKTHSHLVTGLTAGVDYKYYVRCKNSSSSAVNTTDGEISFTVQNGSGTDTTPPTITNKTVGPFNTSTSIILKVDTNEKATCRYSTTDIDYDAMTLDMSVANAEGKSHSDDLGQLTAANYTYYVRCKDEAENKNSSGREIDFTVTSSADTTPPIITNKTGGPFNTSTSITLKVDTNEKAICRYSTTDIGYDAMTTDMNPDSEGKSHSADLGSQLVTGSHTYYVRCKDEAGNKNDSGKPITFNVSASAAISQHHSQLIVLSEQLIKSSLQNVGSLFVSTAIAQTAGATATTGTATTTTSNDEFLEEGNTSEGSGTGAFSSKLKNLKPGTFFYARAYAVSGGTTYYGNQVGFRTADSCFVATAAYGSIFHPSVQLLRDFRNQFLRGNAASRSLTDLYYSYSPSVADLISQHSNLRFAVRMLLLPLTGAAWLALQFGMSALILPAAATMVLVHLRLRRKTQRCPMMS